MLAGSVCALAVLLAPFQQLRHDLKQYTADAAVALVLLVLASRVEREWSRRRLAALVLAVPLGMLVSHPTAIVAGCVFGGLAVTLAARRQWRKLVECLAAGALALVAIATVYLTLSSRAGGAGMRSYWADFLPTLGELPDYLVRRTGTLWHLLGMPAAVLLGLVVCGVVTIARQGRPATAVAVVLLPLAAIALGVAQQYPLLDVRTSHFLLVVTLAVAGIGLCGAGLAIATVLSPVGRTAIAAGICAVLLLGFAWANVQWYRFDGDEPDIPDKANYAIEDVRSATRYVAAHRDAGDVVVVSWSGRYGFLFYWPGEPIRWHPYANTVGWLPELPTQPGILFANEDEATIRKTLDQALAMSAGRVWLVRTHITKTRAAAWQNALAHYRVEEVTGGVEPLAVVTGRIP
jgi:hypothetical protein